MPLQNYTPPKLRKDLYSSYMVALDDVGWDYGFSFTSYGVQLGLRVSDEALLDLMREHVPFNSEHSDAKVVDRLFSIIATGDVHKKSARFSLYWNQSLVTKKAPLKKLIEQFTSFSTIAVAELSEEKLFLHCGVVGWQGKAILIPGRSRAGKSTLVSELVKAGALYYSDEFAVLDQDGLIHAYPRPLSMRHRITQEHKDVLIEDIGGTVGDKPIPVGMVLISEYQKKAKWNPQPVSAGNGLLALLDNTHSAQRAPARAMEILKRVVADADILSSPRGEAAETARMILSE